MYQIAKRQAVAGCPLLRLQNQIKGLITERHKKMKKLIVGSLAAVALAGCAFNPEGMPLGQKDSLVYVDTGAPASLATQESKVKVSVICSAGNYSDYQNVVDTLDSTLNAKLSKFAFFQVVDRKSAEALLKDAVAAGTDAEDLDVSGEEADFVVTATIASLAVQSTGTTYTFDVVYDFKWISTETKRVIMTESIKPTTRAASSMPDLFAALNRAAELASSEFCAKIAVKYAPPSRVLQTRGNGAAARISIGKNYGVDEGTRVCFYEIIDNSDVGGEARDMNDIATGEVKHAEENTSWVKVDNPEGTNVRKGVYVRVLEKKMGWGASLLESSGFGETFNK